MFDRDPLLMQACRVCYYDSTHCHTSGSSGTGIAGADFVLYVSFTSSNCDESTLAFSSYCALEPSLDRYVCIYVCRQCMHAHSIYNF